LGGSRVGRSSADRYKDKLGVTTIKEFAVLDEEWSIANPASMTFSVM
jgi:hypothetical protein